ncbi:MAG: MBL fold metallo-hydrolase [Spirochaetales bacterium]|nr:MBL fold metallo-hydrolase [Spirochaetales bacterium]
MKKFIHYRHATSLILINDKKILIDPVLANKETYPPIIYTKNKRKNPLVNLPTTIDKILNVDGIIITHNHNDHFDILAKKIINKSIPILCQKEDYNSFTESGFKNLTFIDRETTWMGVNIKRFIGTHGGHIYNKKLGVSSSYLLTVKDSTVYLTGDTLLTLSVRKILRKIKPNFIIANGGGARMNLLGKITMNNRDLMELAKINNNSTVIAVHMDSINHCEDTREKLNNINNIPNLLVPKDGEEIILY